MNTRARRRASRAPSPQRRLLAEARKLHGILLERLGDGCFDGKGELRVGATDDGDVVLYLVGEEGNDLAFGLDPETGEPIVGWRNAAGDIEIATVMPNGAFLPGNWEPVFRHTFNPN
jgi:hypothetical protein